MRRLDCGRRDISAEREQHIGLRANEVRGKIGETLRPALRIAVFDRKVVALDVTEIAQGATGCFHLRVSLRGAEQQDAQARDLCRLLRARRERPCCRRANQRDELSPPHVGHGASSRFEPMPPLWPARSVCRTISVPRKGRRVFGHT
jgi:hypothetical protein